jgi:hypothetical protein
MWTWPKRLWLLGGVLLFGGLAIGGVFDGVNDEKGIVGAVLLVAGVMYLTSFLVLPLALLFTLAAFFNRPGEPRHWVWRGRFSLLAYLGWLTVCLFIWMASHLGAGGLDGPCFGQWASERGATEGSCAVKLAQWPPVSSRVVINGPEGHFERLYPGTVGLIVIVSIALVPLALWPLARWLTSDPRGGAPPIRPALWLVGSAVGLSLLASIFIDEDVSRPLNAQERAERNQRAEASREVAEASPSSTEPQATATSVSPRAVATTISNEVGISPQATRCATAASGLGLWTCATTTPDAAVLASRVTVHSDGSFRGVYVDRHGVERAIGGCCLRVGPPNGE